MRVMNVIASCEGTVLMDLYNGFVADFATKIDQIKLMQFIMRVCQQYKSKKIKIWNDFKK